MLPLFRCSIATTQVKNRLKKTTQTVVIPVELIQGEDIAAVLNALDRYDVAMSRSKDFPVNVAR